MKQSSYSKELKRHILHCNGVISKLPELTWQISILLLKPKKKIQSSDAGKKLLRLRIFV